MFQNICCTSLPHTMHVFQTIGSNMLASVESSLCPHLQEPLERQSSCTGPRAESHGACTCFRQACTRGPKRRPASTINSLHSILSSSASILALVILFKDLSAGKHRFEHSRCFVHQQSLMEHMHMHVQSRAVKYTQNGCSHVQLRDACMHAQSRNACMHVQ